MILSSFFLRFFLARLHVESEKCHPLCFRHEMNCLPPRKNKQTNPVYGRCVGAFFTRAYSESPTKGRKSAERNDPLPLGNNFQDPVLEASRTDRWIRKKFLNISFVSNPFPFRERECAHPAGTTRGSLFFSRQQVDPLFKISRLRGAWSRSYANFGEKLGELPGKSISFRPCVFSDLALFTMSYPHSSPSFSLSYTLLLFLVRLHFVITPPSPLRRHAITTCYGLP